jgi:hypothetical protein
VADREEASIEIEDNDVTETLTGKGVPYFACSRPYYAAAVVVMQLLTSDLWIEVLKPFGGLRSRCPALENFGIDSDAALLSALQSYWRPSDMTRDDESAWAAALNQCAVKACHKLLAAVNQGWMTPVMFDRDGNNVMHLALRFWDARALQFLDGQV